MRREPATPRSILVVDDDPVVRAALHDLFEEEGFAVQSAADGRKAIELAKRAPPDLVVLDITLPVLNGYEVASALRDVHGPQLPIRAISADGSVTEARLPGADLRQLDVLPDEHLGPARLVQPDRLDHDVSPLAQVFLEELRPVAAILSESRVSSESRPREQARPVASRGEHYRR